MDARLNMLILAGLVLVLVVRTVILVLDWVPAA